MAISMIAERTLLLVRGRLQVIRGAVRPQRQVNGALPVYCVVLAVSLFVTVPAVAQSVRGVVQDIDTAEPIPGVEIFAYDTLQNVIEMGVSDADGRFGFELAPGAYQFQLFRIGYSSTIVSPVSISRGGGTVNLTITLERVVVALDTVVVEGAEQPAVPVALEGFYARKERGWGLYLDRPEIEAKSPVWSTDILLNEPGVRVVPEGGNRFRIEMVGQVSLGGGPCPPAYYLDGFKYIVDPELGINRELSANHVQAVEVYRGASETPAEFLDSDSRCGVVVIWTRRE